MELSEMLVSVGIILISVYTALLILVLTQFFSIKEKMGTFEANLTNFSNRLDAWQNETRTIGTDLYKFTSGRNIGNPLTKKQKDILIEKYRNGTLTRPEAEQFKEVLEKEKRDAENSGDLLDALIVGIMLGGLAYLLSKLLEDKK